MQKFYTAKYDVIFKTIFCDENNNKLLKVILSEILEREVKHLIFLNKELPIKKRTEKLKIVDVLAIVDNEYVHIELNSNNLSYLHPRNLTYFCDIYATKNKRGENYNAKTKFIHIDFTYRMKEKYDYRRYKIQSDKKEKYVENFEIIEYNMDRIKEYCYNGNKEKYEKYKHLIMIDMNEEELEKFSKGDEVMKEYKEKIQMINDTDKYESFITPEEDFQYCLNSERELGLEEGLTQGINQGITDLIKRLTEQNYSEKEILSIANISKEKYNELLKNI